MAKTASRELIHGREYSYTLRGFGARMRALIIFTLFHSLQAICQDSFLSSQNYAFVSGSPIFLLDVPISNSHQTKRVCFARFARLRTKLHHVAVASPLENSDCTSVDKYGQTANSHIFPAAPEGSTDQSFSKESDSVINIGGRDWRVWDALRVISVKTAENQKKEAEYSKVCTMFLIPKNSNGDSPSQRHYFCKALGPIRFQAKTYDGTLMYEKGEPLMVDSMVCPLPEKCLSKEFAIQPTMTLMPETDDDLTPHATASTSLRNH